MFEKLNLNPKNHKASDCVVRAISYATGKSWEEVYRALCEIGLEECDMPNSKKVWHKYLDKLGWQKMPMPRFSDNTRYTLSEFCESAVKNKSEICIVSIAHHLVSVKGKTFFDTWNCGHKSVGNYWVKF